MKMDALEHDPRTKQQIKEALYAYIYGPVSRQFQQRMESLVLRNTNAGGFFHKHFVYKGLVYNVDTTPAPLKRNRLLPEFRAEMDQYLEDVNQLNNQELPYVLGFITQVLNSSNSLADYLKVFPEAIHSPLHELMNTCPCRIGHLSGEKVQYLLEKNQTPVSLIKQRLVTNLII